MEQEKPCRDPFFQERDLASFTECTGLVPARSWDEEEDENYAQLYDLHRTPNRE